MVQYVIPLPSGGQVAATTHPLIDQLEKKGPYLPTFLSDNEIFQFFSSSFYDIPLSRVIYFFLHMLWSAVDVSTSSKRCNNLTALHKLSCNFFPSLGSKFMHLEEKGGDMVKGKKKKEDGGVEIVIALLWLMCIRRTAPGYWSACWQQRRLGLPLGQQQFFRCSSHIWCSQRGAYKMLSNQSCHPSPLESRARRRLETMSGWLE